MLPSSPPAPGESPRKIKAAHFVAVPVLLAAGGVLLASSTFAGSIPGAGSLRFAIYASVLTLALAHPAARAKFPPLLFLVSSCGLVALAVFSTGWSAAAMTTALRSAGFFLLLSMALFGFARMWTCEPEVRRCVRAVSLAAGLFFLFGLVLLALGESRVFELAYDTGKFRFQGAMVSPNSIGVLAALTVPLMVALWRSSSGLGERWVWAAGICAALLSLLLSQSRGGFVALGFGVTTFFFLDRNLLKARAAAAVAIVLLCITSVFVAVPETRPGFIVELEERLTAQAGTATGGSGRTAAWALAVDIWEERPISGWGFGSAETVFGPRSLEIEQVFQGNNPHNSYFNTLLELGPLGLGLLLLAVLAVLYVGLGLRSTLGAGVAGALVAAVAVSVFESGLTSPGSVLGFSFWFLASTATRLRALKE